MEGGTPISPLESFRMPEASAGSWKGHRRAPLRLILTHSVNFSQLCRMSYDPDDDAGFPEEDNRPYGFIAHYLIRSSPERCWDHWADEALLSRWLATRAEADARSGRDYFIRSVIPYHSGRHRVEEVMPGKSIGFTWYMDDFPCHLEVTIKPHPLGSELLIEQRVDSKLPETVYCGFDPEALSFQRQTWDYAIGRLRCMLENGIEDMAIPDDDRDDEVHLSIGITASRQDVFTALTEDSLLEAWEAMYMEGGVIGKGVGGRYSFGWETEIEDGDGPNQIEEWIEGAKLAYSWFGSSPGLVTWDLTEEPGGVTRVNFRHVGFGQDPLEVWEYKLGWSSSLFALKWYLEKGEPHGFWMQYDLEQS